MFRTDATGSTGEQSLQRLGRRQNESRDKSKMAGSARSGHNFPCLCVFGISSGHCPAVISAGMYDPWQKFPIVSLPETGNGSCPEHERTMEADRIHSFPTTSQAPRGSPQPMCYPSVPPSAVVLVEFRRRRAPPSWPRSCKSRILSSGRHRHRREYSCFACAFAYRSPLNSAAYPETLCKG